MASRGGFSLLDVMMAMSVIAIGIMGSMGALLLLHQHNTHGDEQSRAYRACQEVVEQLLGMDYDTMLAQDGLTFVAPQLHPTTPVGAITVTDISPPGTPDSFSEIRVRIQTSANQVSTVPLDVELVHRRSRQ